MGEHLAASRCPHCGVDQPHLRQIGQFSELSSARTEVEWFVYCCNRCAGAVLYGGQIDPLTRAPLHRFRMFPGAYPESELPPELPTQAQRFLKQAIESATLAPDGSVMLAASALDAMLKDKGLANGSLYARIQQAATAHLITEEMGAWAHDVRLDANDQRHADESSSPAMTADAQRAIDFVRAFGEYMFVLPARVRRGRDAAASKK